MNEIDKFFSGLPSEDKQPQDVFGEQKTPPVANTGVVPAKGDENGDDNEPRKNRRERRLTDQLRRERESNIALNERVRVLAEIGNSGQPITNGEMPPEWIALHGNTDESKSAWAIQMKLINGLKEQAKTEAIQEFQASQAAEIEEQREFESYVDSELEAIEDEKGIDLTSNAPAARKMRREFLELVHNLSPKNESGELVGFADFGSTFDVYHKTLGQKPVDQTMIRQKEIAGKSMQENNGNASEQQTFTPGFRGWQKDYNLLN